MTRDRIDWENLQPLPRKARPVNDREILAERRFHAQKAKHKGRNHVHNWQRRQMAAEAAEAGRRKQEKAKSKAARFIDAVRAYWREERDEHP